MAAHHIEDALERLRSEFLAIPSLSLTPGEIARILNVDPPTAWVSYRRSKRRTSWNAHGTDDSPFLCHVPNCAAVPCVTGYACMAACSGWRTPTRQKPSGCVGTASTS